MSLIKKAIEYKTVLRALENRIKKDGIKELQFSALNSKQLKRMIDEYGLANKHVPGAKETLDANKFLASLNRPNVGRGEIYEKYSPELKIRDQIRDAIDYVKGKEYTPERLWADVEGTQPPYWENPFTQLYRNK